MTHRMSAAGPRRPCALSPMSLCGGALTAAAMTTLPSIAHAQDPGAESAPMVAEVVVTSRRIEENLQATPVAVTALSGTELEARGINSLAQIEAVTPNLNFDSSANISGSNSAASVFIRGVGQTDFQLTTDPGVGIFIDGVYVSRGVGGSMDLVNIERVEVLKGPQGTLFGKNTIGGAISIVTRRPGNELTGRVKVARGSFDRLEASASVDIPVSDNLLTSFSLASIDSDGYVKRIAPDLALDGQGLVTSFANGEGLGDDNSVSFRGDALWHGSENFDARLVVERTRERENGAPLVAVAINPNSDFNLFWNNFVAPLLQPTIGDLAFFNERYLTGSPYLTYSTARSASDLDLWGTTLTLDWEVGDNLNIRSISAWRDVESFFTRDFDYSPLEHSPSFNIFEYRTISQELQLSGSPLSGRLRWLAGLFYFDETGSDNNSPRFPVVAVRSGGSVDNDSAAAYLSATYEITDRWHVSGGIRYSDETVRFTPDQVVLELGRAGVGLPPPGIPNFALSDFSTNPPLFVPVQVGDRILPFEEVSQSIRKWTPQLSMQYFWTDEIQTYVSYSEGFKNGGFTQRVFPPQAATPAYRPEEVKVYEVGLKSDLLDARVRLNAAAFYTDYTDVQIVINEGIAPTIRNAARGRVQGGEAELTALLTNHLQLTSSVGYVDAGFRKLDDPAAAAAVGLFVTNKFPNTPEWSLGSSLSYTHGLGSLGKLTWRGDWSYRSTVYTDAVNTPELTQPGVHLLNASVTFASADGDWRLSLYGKNLTDEAYITSGFNDISGNGVIEAVYSRPREWLVELGYNF